MPTIKKKNVSKNDTDSHYTANATVANDPNQIVKRVELSIINTLGNPSAEPIDYALNYIYDINGMRMFKNEHLSFDGSAEGHEYQMTFTMYDKFNNVIPTPVSGMMVVEEPMILA
jgi:hypothetical protein